MARRRTPFSLALCHAMIRAGAQLVPRAQRQEWKREWSSEVVHRRQFLLDAGRWNRRQAMRLVRACCLGVWADAKWHAASRQHIESREREWTRSPWLCVGTWAGLVALVGALSGGFAATRQVLSGPQQERANLFAIWLHPIVGGGDKNLPAELAPAWARRSTLLESAAGFTVRHASVSGRGLRPTRRFVVTTEPSLFRVFDARPEFGTIPRESAVVLDHQTWVSMFHSDRKAIGATVMIGDRTYRVAGILTPDFRFLSRQPSLYVIEEKLTAAEAMTMLRAKPGVTDEQLNRELTRIAEDCCYYFYNSQLRLRSLQSAMLTPVAFFGIAVLIAILMLASVSRFRVRGWRAGLSRHNRAATLRRVEFFTAKTGLALAFVFAAGLEWSRSDGSLLFAARDPASGPFLVWLYILGAMGVLFWSLADQRARCRVCLRLLCFPVRIGCPGCLLLDWSGTELLCSEGHGVLHVPLMAASWDQQADHWIALDESWHDLFAQSR